MKLFYGSNIDIDSISLAMCRPYKDFGRGFYLTDIEEQAERMAVRVSRIYGGTPVVNFYEIEDDFRNIPDLRIKDFGVQTTEEWAKFVMNNRSRAFTDEKSDLCNKDNKYDIVIGAMANDQIYNFVSDYIDGVSTREQFWTLAKFKYPTHQINFCTENALKCLEYRGYEVVK